MEIINKNLKIKKYTEPYPYIVFENFFDNNFYEIIEEKFPSLEDFKKYPNKINRMNFDTSFPDDLYNKLTSEVSQYQTLHEYIYSKKFMEYFINIFEKDIKDEISKGNLKNVLDYNLNCNPYEVHKIYSKKDLEENLQTKILYPRLDIGAGIKGYGKNTGGKGIHVDNPQRLISILFYSGGYTKMVGGELRIWEKYSEELKISNIIKPKPNSLVASLQNNISFHDVNPVEDISGSRNAFYIAISANEPIWKKIENNKFNIKYHKNRVTKKSKFSLLLDIFR